MRRSQKGMLGGVLAPVDLPVIGQPEPPRIVPWGLRKPPGNEPQTA
jgi:hypothetical protein